MAEWNEIFNEEKYIKKIPESIIMNFLEFLERKFSERPLKILDFLCGGGRHTIAAAQRGHSVFGFDKSENGIQFTKSQLKEPGLMAEFSIGDMTELPEKPAFFHGGFSWDALHHNTIKNIKITVEKIKHNIKPGGYFLCNLLSTKSDSRGNGNEIEPETFIKEDGLEAGVMHHYFDEEEILDLFNDWEIIYLNEQINRYVKRTYEGFNTNPFPYTKWMILAMVPGSTSPHKEF